MAPSKRKRDEKVHEVSDVQFEDEKLILRVDGEEHRFELTNISEKLANATPEQRSIYTISPSGYGIHWTLLDEDLSIDGLLCTEHHPDLEKTA